VTPTLNTTAKAVQDAKGHYLAGCDMMLLYLRPELDPTDAAGRSHYMAGAAAAWDAAVIAVQQLGGAQFEREGC
jgi:hypothetical protein